MTRGERYTIRAEISRLHVSANLCEDRQTEDGRTKAAEFRARANELNESLRRTK